MFFSCFLWMHFHTVSLLCFPWIDFHNSPSCNAWMPFLIHYASVLLCWYIFILSPILFCSDTFSYLLCYQPRTSTSKRVVCVVSKPMRETDTSGEGTGMRNQSVASVRIFPVFSLSSLEVTATRLPVCGSCLCVRVVALLVLWVTWRWRCMGVWWPAV